MAGLQPLKPVVSATALMLQSNENPVHKALLALFSKAASQFWPAMM